MSTSCSGIYDACPNANVGASSQLFLALINALVGSQCALDPRPTYQDSVTLEDDSHYDFIVIGAGSAGAVVANRLTENPEWNVLLIEAGTYPSITSEIPAIFTYLQQTREDWNYTGFARNGCKGFKNTVCYLPRGKVLGGSSTINALLYVRGNDRDYDRWEELGNRNWGWSTVYRYFLRSENTSNPAYAYSPNHGHSGYLTTSDIPSTRIVKDVIFKSAREMGETVHADAAPLGYYETLLTIENRRRCSTAKAFLSKIKGRPNLYLATDSEVTKINIDPFTNTATGVVVKTNDNLVTINTNKEIILSAGAVNSPKILMSSGIGLRSDVESPIQELAVGRNLQDHYMFVGLFVALNDSATDPTTPTGGLDDIYNYYLTNTGPMSGIDVSNVFGFINTRHDSKYPDIQIHHFFYPKNDRFIFPSVLEKFGYNDRTAASLLEANKRYNLLLLATTLLNPKSHGSVRFKQGKVSIDLNYLGEAEDQEKLLKAVKYVERSLLTPTMRSVGATILRYDTVNCNDKTGDDYWLCLLSNFGTTVYHQACTCKMGPPTDSEAVVDDRLKVYGIKQLRVVDASIMPNIVSGNTNAPTIMIGERASDIIKMDNGYDV